MYEKVLNEKAVAGEIVDQLRDHTNASLSSCIDAARVILNTISEFVSDESFEKIASAVRSFEVDVDNCIDQRVLQVLVKNLGQILQGKEELSYSVSQDDAQLIEYLDLLSDTVRKTDPRIAYNSVSRNDFEWLNSLINLFQLDQNTAVRNAVVSCLNVLTSSCPGLAPFLMESKLLVVIALQIPPPNKQMDAINISSLLLFSRIFSCSSVKPPLSHFETINTSFVERLLGHFENHGDVILDCLIAINHSACADSDNPVIMALCFVRIPLFGEVFTSYFNKRCSEHGLILLKNILNTDRLLEDLFYSNDLEVLKHVLGREMINNESEAVRNFCFSIIEDMVNSEISCGDLHEAIENSTQQESEKSRVLEKSRTLERMLEKNRKELASVHF